MAQTTGKVLTPEEEMQLLQPIDSYVGTIQAKIDDLRREGTDKIIEIGNAIEGIKRDRVLTKDEQKAQIDAYLSLIHI